jgi:hypothetical protein
MAIEIVKVQRPRFPLDAPWLVYDEAREHILRIPDEFVPEDVKRAMGGDYQAFFRGLCKPTGELKLGERVEDQVW